MNARPARLLRLPPFVLCRLFPIACFLSAGGCSFLPEARTDPTRFYVLSTGAARMEPTAQPNSPTLHLKQIELASYLRARPLIVRRGNNEIEFREFARWGEPLDAGIIRVLREELLARGAAGAVTVPGMRRDAVNHDYSLTLRVLACEGGVGGTVEFRAVWELTNAKPGANSTAVAGGEFRPTDLHWDGKTEASLTAELSRAVAGLAGEISAGLKK